jgi:hypothetical protein
MAAVLASSDDVADRSKAIAIWQFMNFVSAQPPGQGFPIKRLLDRVRRLVRLAEDRDLRQMPAAAQSLDAVRLMTVHGAKGLEFKAVHLPGMNEQTLPRTFQKPACPPPDGLIDGAADDGMAALQEGHEQEQECLFFVAMSRARDRLMMYAAEKKENDHRRNLSPFLGLLEDTIVRSKTIPELVLPGLPEDEPIELEPDGSLRFAASQLGLYESCPRRFLYTYILRIGGRRVATSFMKMHESVAVIVRKIVDDGLEVQGNALREEVEKACREAGIEETPQFGEYVSLAVGLLEYFQQSRKGMQKLEPTDIVYELDGQEITFRPDDIVVENDVVRVRRIRTGHRRSTDTKDSGAAALRLAANAAFEGAIVELVHLSDGEMTPLPLSRGDGGRAKLSTIFAGISQGEFPTKASTRTCPGCPAFFVCGPVPKGALAKKF